MSKAQIIQGIMEKLSRTMRVSIPATIVTYDYAQQKASVQIALKEYYSEENILEYPIISNVPVMFLSSGGASFTMPVKKDDSCLLLFMDRDISAWLLGSKNEVPMSRRSHHLNDAIALIGLNNLVTTSKAENKEDVLLTYSGSDVRLKPDGKIDIHSANEINVKTKDVIINCTNATINSEEKIDITCKHANLKASTDIQVECENANITATKNIIAKAERANIEATKEVKLKCDNAVIEANENANIECQNANITGNLKVTGNVDITGTTKIAQKLTTQSGIENSGANLVSNGKTFETHTHQYQNVTTVTAPDGPCVVNKVPTNTGAP